MGLEAVEYERLGGNNTRKKEACDEFLNRNTFPEDRELYKWDNNVLYKKIVKNNKIDKNKNNINYSEKE